MKQKFAYTLDLERLVGDKPWERRFFRFSPLVEITEPKGFVFAAGSANRNLLADAVGGRAVAGVDNIRYDELADTYKLYHYSLELTVSAGTYSIRESKPRDLHYLPEIPEALRPPFVIGQTLAFLRFQGRR